MRAYKCDRCGNYFDEESGSLYLAEPVQTIPTKKFLDICPVCQKELDDWFEEGREASDESLHMR